VAVVVDEEVVRHEVKDVLVEAFGQMSAKDTVE
jgi:hypothetical protein